MDMRLFLNSLCVEERSHLKRILFEEDKCNISPDVIRLINLYKTPIGSPYISVRCYNLLRSLNLYSIGDVLTCKKTTFRRVKYLGESTFREIEYIFFEHNVKFDYFTDEIIAEAKKVMLIENNL